MRVEDVDEQLLIAADEQLSSLEDVVRVMPTAQYLNVAFNSLSSLSGLEQMKELRSLDISHNSIESLQEVAALSNLLVLKCSNNQIADLSWIAGLDGLEELWLRGNLIENAQLAHLQQLIALQTLAIHPNPCTERDDYVLAILKVMPWLQRVDTTVVTEELREEARHAEERGALDSGATDCSLFSLSGRADDPALTENPSERQTEITPEVSEPTKSKKQMTVEEFMRAFPVQDFIPLEGNGLSVVEADNQTFNMGAKDADSGLPSLMPAETHTKDDENEILKSASEEDGIHIENQEVFEDRQRPQLEANAGGSSELLNSVLRLPTFGKDSFFQKKKPHSQLPGNGKTKLRSKPKKKATLFNEASESSLSFHQDEEYIVAYPNSTVTAIQVRYDGSAIARWPSGNVAVSVDFETSAERSGFRVYAAHKDGQLALSFDPVGVGFLNAYPSGKTLISTTSEGDGILFDASSGAILRQWDAQGHLRDGTGQVVDSLADEIDGSLLCCLSEYLAVRVQLVRTEPTQLESSSHVKQATALRRNLIALQIYFAGAPGIRHIFVNSANRAQPPDTDACACAFGKTSTTEGMARVVKAKPPLVEHADLLSSIRAAVAGL